MITDHISRLSANEVAARKARGEVNAPPPPPGRTYRQIIIGNVFSFINNVFYVLCLLLVLLGRPFDAILPLVVVLANVAVSVFQEVRAKRKLDKIALLTRPTAKVIRDGREQTVDPGKIVCGDLLLVGAWARPSRMAYGSSLSWLAIFAVPAGLAVTLVGLLLFVGYILPVFDLAADGSVAIEEINAVLKDTLPRAQTVLTYFLTVCGLLLVIFVEPPSRFWASSV